MKRSCAGGVAFAKTIFRADVSGAVPSRAAKQLLRFTVCSPLAEERISPSSRESTSVPFSGEKCEVSLTGAENGAPVSRVMTLKTVVTLVTVGVSARLALSAHLWCWHPELGAAVDRIVVRVFPRFRVEPLLRIAVGSLPLTSLPKIGRKAGADVVVCALRFLRGIIAFTEIAGDYEVASSSLPRGANVGSAGFVRTAKHSLGLAIGSPFTDLRLSPLGRGSALLAFSSEKCEVSFTSAVDRRAVSGIIAGKAIVTGSLRGIW